MTPGVRDKAGTHQAEFVGRSGQVQPVRAPREGALARDALEAQRQAAAAHASYGTPGQQHRVVLGQPQPQAMPSPYHRPVHVHNNMPIGMPQYIPAAQKAPAAPVVQRVIPTPQGGAIITLVPATQQSERVPLGKRT